jgi:hypothetical protein
MMISDPGDADLSKRLELLPRDVGRSRSRAIVGLRTSAWRVSAEEMVMVEFGREEMSTTRPPSCPLATRPGGRGKPISMEIADDTEDARRSSTARVDRVSSCSM